MLLLDSTSSPSRFRRLVRKKERDYGIVVHPCRRVRRPLQCMIFYNNKLTTRKSSGEQEGITILLFLPTTGNDVLSLSEPCLPFLCLSLSLKNIPSACSSYSTNDYHPSTSLFHPISSTCTSPSSNQPPPASLTHPTSYTHPHPSSPHPTNEHPHHPPHH